MSGPISASSRTTNHMKPMASDAHSSRARRNDHERREGTTSGVTVAISNLLSPSPLRTRPRRASVPPRTPAALNYGRQRLDELGPLSGGEHEGQRDHRSARPAAQLRHLLGLPASAPVLIQDREQDAGAVVLRRLRQQAGL